MRSRRLQAQTEAKAMLAMLAMLALALVAVIVAVGAAAVPGDCRDVVAFSSRLNSDDQRCAMGMYLQFRGGT